MISTFKKNIDIHVVMAMSGQGTRYQKAGYTEPKPLIPVNGVPIIERLLSNFPSNWTYTFVLAENHKNTALPNTLEEIRPECEILYIPPHKEGPGKAIEIALETSRLLKKFEGAILVSYCDYGMIWDPYDFQRFVSQTECDACLISYRGFHAHYENPQMYAYSRLNSEQMVIEVKEKGCFTNNRENEFASCGAYYFRNQLILEKSLKYQRSKKHLILNGELYTSLTTQALLEENPNALVRIYEIPYFFQWGTPQDLADYEYWEKTWHSKFNFQNNQFKQKYDNARNMIVFMPMAGSGKRIIETFGCEKPILNILGKSMFKIALDSLPKGEQKAILCLDSVQEKIKHILESHKETKTTTVFSIPKTPEGQALSTLKGIEFLKQSIKDFNQEILISSCDHEIVFDHKLWNDFLALKDCDAAIFCVRNYPGVRVTPNSFAYVETETNNRDTFPLVKQVHVKRPFSSNPEKDRLLVGTFWFKNLVTLEMNIQELVEKNIRVNNELYLDSIFNLMIEKNLKIRCFDLSGYINYGDCGSLKQAMYWHEVFSRTRGRVRHAFDGVEQKLNWENQKC